MSQTRDKINKSDFLEWKQHPVTQAYLSGLKEEVEQLKEALASGQYVNTDSLSATGANYISAVGRVSQIRDILSINEVDFEEV